MSSREIQILLVEDNPGDVRLTVEALKEVTEQVELSVAHNGVEALAFLEREGRFAESPRPDLILLDLNLPILSGMDVLARIKSDPRFKHIPVAVLSTSSSQVDIDRSYGQHANCYLTKPVDLDSFVALVRKLDQFWTSAVELPSGNRYE